MSGYRPPYLWTEERDIVHYLIDNNALHRTRSDALWKEMADSGKFRRTWQSMKQHFRKKLIFKLNSDYYGLSETDAADVKKAFDDSARKNKLPTNSCGNKVEEASSSKTIHTIQENSSAKDPDELLRMLCDMSNIIIHHASSLLSKKKAVDLKKAVDDTELQLSSDSSDNEVEEACSSKTTQNKVDNPKGKDELLEVLSDLRKSISHHALSPVSKKDATDLKKAFDDTVIQLSSDSSDDEVEEASSSKMTQKVDNPSGQYELLGIFSDLRKSILHQASSPLSKIDAADLKKVFDDTVIPLSSDSSDDEVERGSSQKTAQDNNKTGSSSETTQKKLDNSSSMEKLKDLTLDESLGIVADLSNSILHHAASPQKSDARQLSISLEDVSPHASAEVVNITHISKSLENISLTKSACAEVEGRFSVSEDSSLSTVPGSVDHSASTKSSSTCNLPKRRKNQFDHVQSRVRLYRLEIQKQQQEHKKKQAESQKIPNNPIENDIPENLDHDTLLRDLKIYKDKFAEANLSNQLLQRQVIDLMKENADMKIRMDHFRLEAERYKNMFTSVQGHINETPEFSYSDSDD